MQQTPIRVTGRLDEPLSRWLWLIKWITIIPHLIVLWFLFVGFAVVWVIALFAILFTGSYPRALFDYTVGVLRWSWRVAFYSYSALGTDRYPPFTLKDVPDYPARLEVERPERLSRGLVLVKWWLPALPQYAIVGVLAGAWNAEYSYPGLIALLVFFSAVLLLFRGSYPAQTFGLIVGLNRWVLRVVVYASLLRDEYPPLRLDAGEAEPAPDAQAGQA